MKKNAKALVLFLLTITLFNCFEDDFDDNPVSTIALNDFVYRAMDIHYLYRDSVPSLIEDKRSSSNYNTYLNNFSTPENLFESLIYDRQYTDRFSWITNDYIALEQQFEGTTKSNGMEYGLVRYSENSDAIFGYVRYILPNTSASNSTLQRGDLFYAVNNTPLTTSNWRTLLGEDNYTINLATYNDNGTTETNDDTIEPSTESITLNKVAYTENPVFKTEVISTTVGNVGYLMYNGFTANFNDDLNNAFANFQSNNVQHLVLDFRYNPGGSVNSATLLGSMVTGQFNGQTYTKLVFNSLLQDQNSNYNFTNSYNNGTTAINSLNLSKVYVIAGNSSASASELVINSLKEYIEVIHIGSNTTGKSQASITIYDSPNYNRSNINTTHTYALQPLVAISVNANNGQVPANGLTPNIELTEQINNLGSLGDENEPLLAEALLQITTSGRMANPTTRESKGKPVIEVGDANDLLPFTKEMYIEKQ